MLCDIGAWAGFGVKTLIDEGYHPLTVYFLLMVHGSLLVELTESESKHSLDRFIAALAGFTERGHADDTEFFHETRRHTPRRILSEAAE